MTPSQLWRENVATVQLLGLCPLLAVSHSFDTAIGLSVASSFVLIGSATIVSLIRRWIVFEIRLPMFVLVIASFTTISVLIIEAFAMSLFARMALFLQIIVTNCMILGRLTQVASKEKVSASFLDAVLTSIGFSAVLIALGAIRETTAHVLPIVAYPAGAFLTFGLLLAVIQYKPRRLEEVVSSNITTVANT